MSQPSRGEQEIGTALLGVAAVCAAAAAAAYLTCAAVVWATSRSLPPLADALPAMARLPAHLSDPRTAFAGTSLQGTVPGTGWFWVLLILAVVGQASGVVAAWLRVDALRGRRRLGLRPYDPRSRITPRSFARPRDLTALRTGLADSWTTIRLDGRLIGTAPQSHMLLVAPTRSGKTTGPVRTWAIEHEGPALITSTKADIVHLTARERARHGPIWIYAPGVPDTALPQPGCGWSPLLGCQEWEHAQRTGRWLASANAGRGETQESDGARFYNHEAGRLLAPLLHAAALSGQNMLTVNRWVRAEDPEPLTLLRRASAEPAARLLDSFRKMEGRARTLTIASAGQLIDAYEHETIAATDRPGFEPAELLRGGTLYLVAPEAQQRLVGPLFGALLGSVFRAAEAHALEHGPLCPELRVILDEARRLAAIEDLPALLSVGAGWGLRIATVWQNLEQITARYGKASDEVLGNSLAKLVLGPIQDRGTREYLVDLLDEETSNEDTLEVDALGATRPRTRQRRMRRKASAQKLQQLSRGEGLLVQGEALPARGKVPR